MRFTTLGEDLVLCSESKEEITGLCKEQKTTKVPELGSDVLEEGWYKLSSISDRRVDPGTLSYMYKASFEGYSKSEDVWLPSSSFNMSIAFETKSQRGRVRKHAIDPNFLTEVTYKHKKGKSQIKNTETEQVDQSVGYNLWKWCAPWGGESGTYKITNTCTIDHWLSQLMIEYCQDETFRDIVNNNTQCDLFRWIA